MTDSAPPSGMPQDDAERRRRLDALRDLARNVEGSAPAEPQASAPTTTPAAYAVALKAPQRRRRALLMGALAALALIAVVVGVFGRGPLAARLAGHAGPAITSRIVTLGDKVKLYCPSTPAWSPDGRQIAVLAQTSPSLGDCGTPTYGQTLLDSALSTSPPTPLYAIAIIDASSGKVERAIPFLLPTMSALCGARCAPQDGYIPFLASYNPLNAISWSPDGKTIGFFFTYNVGNVKMAVNGAQVNGIQWYGVLQLIPVNGSGDARTLLATSYVQPGPDRPYPNKFFHSAPVYIWNLATGASSYAVIPNNLLGEATTPFAAAYGWAANGQITPQNSAGASTFSPWISGQLRAANVTSRVFEYTATLWRWSPDGRYVAPNMTVQAFVRAPGVLDEPPPFNTWDYIPPLVAAPDLAMAKLLKEISKPQVTAEVAWSPNGKLLAGLDCSHGADTARLTVRRGNDGGGLVTTTFMYPPTMNSQGCDGDMEALAWSSDNASVASGDATANEVVIWRYSA
jgi:hypothetical protein